MKHGFKAQAERKANALREQLRIPPSKPLLGKNLAKHLKVKIASADRLLSIESSSENSLILPEEFRQQLWENDTSSWSAFTISHEVAGTWIFYNPTHNKGRHESNVMHEISHIVCKHEPSKFMAFNNMAFSLRTCDAEQEEEADWLCGCLKLPRDGLLWAVRRKMSNSKIADHFVTSLEMVQWRRNKTGVDRQLKR